MLEELWTWHSSWKWTLQSVRACFLITTVDGQSTSAVFGRLVATIQRVCNLGQCTTNSVFNKVHSHVMDASSRTRKKRRTLSHFLTNNYFEIPLTQSHTKKPVYQVVRECIYTNITSEPAVIAPNDFIILYFRSTAYCSILAIEKVNQICLIS